MRFLRSYVFLFDNPSWPANLLLGAGCLLIPLIGPVVFLGYACEVLDSLHQRGDKEHVDFDLSRFQAYLLRGLWPAGALLLVYGPVLAVFGFLAYLIWALGVSRAVGALLWSTFGLGVAITCLLVALVAVPLALRAGLGRQLGLETAKPFVGEFLKRTWIELLLAGVFALVTGQVVLLGGAGLCCVGAYPAGVLVLCAQVHLLYQLYELYLERGGVELSAPASSVASAEEEKSPSEEG